MERRTFFAGAAALVAGAPLAEPGMAQGGSRTAPFPRRKGRLKQGLWKINWGNGSTVPFDEMCTVAARMGAYGFDVIPPRDWAILRRHGLDPLMVGPGNTDYLGGLIHPEIHAQTLAAISARADLCTANRRPALPLEERRMCLLQKTDGAGHRNVRMCQSASEPIGLGPLVAVNLQGSKRGVDLRAAAIHPSLRCFGMQDALINEAHRLVIETGCQGANFQHSPPNRPAGSHHRPRGPRSLVEIVENGGTLDQCLPVIEQECWHPPQGIVRSDLLRITEGRPRPVLIGEAVESQCDGDASHER